MVHRWCKPHILWDCLISSRCGTFNTPFT